MPRLFQSRLQECEIAGALADVVTTSFARVSVSRTPASLSGS